MYSCRFLGCVEVYMNAWFMGCLEFDMNAWFLDFVQVDMNTWFKYGYECFGVGH